MDGRHYPLYQEEGVHLHGGAEGFHQKYWGLEEVVHGEVPYVKFSYSSQHLEEGYPGNLLVNVTYKLYDNALQIIHEAVTDKTTVVNLTNHSYFKLDDAPFIDDYTLQLNCPYYLPLDDSLLPTGQISPVKETALNYLLAKKIGIHRLNTPFVKDLGTEKVGEIKAVSNGLSMKIYTNQPVVVVYTPTDFPGICFETQHFPDAPNQENFPSSVLQPGKNYNNISIFKFDWLS